jgi:hypothetical protein
MSSPIGWTRLATLKADLTKLKAEVDKGLVIEDPQVSHVAKSKRAPPEIVPRSRTVIGS